MEESEAEFKIDMKLELVPPQTNINGLYWEEKYKYPEQRNVLGKVEYFGEKRISIYPKAIMFRAISEGRDFMDELSATISHEVCHVLFDEIGIYDAYAEDWALDNVEGFLYG